jgi:hypothetical protein
MDPNQLPKSNYSDNPSPLAITNPPAIKPKSKLPLIIGAVCGAMVLLVVILAIAVASQGSKPKTTPKVATTTAAADQAQPATALDVEQTNNSINQSLSSISDVRDFGNDSLSDPSLGL